MIQYLPLGMQQPLPINYTAWMPKLCFDQSRFNDFKKYRSDTFMPYSGPLPSSVFFNHIYNLGILSHNCVRKYLTST